MGRDWKTPREGDVPGAHIPSTVLEFADGEGKIPATLLVPKRCRPTRNYDKWGDIPVIDLSSKHRGELRKTVGDAAREWGAFQVINHGVSIEKLLQVQQDVKEFFHSPIERKQELNLDPDNFVNTKVYYTGDNSKQELHSLHWAESLVSLWKEWDELEEKVNVNTSLIWPGGNETFRAGTEEILKGCRDMTEEILHLLAEYLGLETDFFTISCFPKGTSFFRWNYYPKCPLPRETLGAHAHTDPNLLTVLYQDKLGGLQVQRGDDWYGVDPMEEAFVINIGDCLAIYTNEILHSVVHQVLVNEKAHRLSLAIIYYLDHSTEMSAPEVLVNDKNPRKFKPLTSGEYWRLIFNERIARRSPASLNGIRALRKRIVGRGSKVRATSMYSTTAMTGS